jgi:hypothetical protein
MPGDNLLDFEFPTIDLEPLGNRSEGNSVISQAMNSDFAGTLPVE